MARAAGARAWGWRRRPGRWGMEPRIAEEGESERGVLCVAPHMTASHGGARGLQCRARTFPGRCEHA